MKGDNVLVSATDGQVFLTDFGSGHYVGAATLTSSPFPPGTPPYRSPEAWRSVRLPFSRSATPYAPAAADDVFALGMTAYRLPTNNYPPTSAPMGEDSNGWSPEAPGPLAPHIVNVRCCAELSEHVSRMLSVRPEARDSARSLAEALEQAVQKAGPEADVPLFARQDSQPVEARDVRPHVVPRAARRPRWSWLAAASLGGTVALGAGWLLSAQPRTEPEQVHASSPENSKDGGTVAVGDTALTAPVTLSHTPSVWSTISVDVPPRPLPGQTRADAAGRCPSRVQIPINGGCWTKVALSVKDCDANFDYYVYKGECYGPAFPPARPPTSGPTGPSRDDAP